MATKSKNPFGFGEILDKMVEVKRVVPVKIANEAQKFFVGAFNQQGWTPYWGLVPWKNVQRRIPGTRAYKSAKKSRRIAAILVNTGKLRREVNNSAKQVSFDRIVFEVNLSYAGYLNEGTSKMPARKFIGESLALNRKVEEVITTEVDKIWKR